jgi:hypothetical protein
LLPSLASFFSAESGLSNLGSAVAARTKDRLVLLALVCWNYGPSGEHLITLIKHSDAVLSVVLAMADRRQLLVGSKIDEIEKRLNELADLIRSQRQAHESGKE